MYRNATSAFGKYRFENETWLPAVCQLKAVTLALATCCQSVYRRKDSLYTPDALMHLVIGAVELSKYPNVHIVQMDVTKDNDMEDALVLVKNSLGSKVLWAVVANAGISISGLIEWQSMQSIRKVFEVNVFGVVRVCKKFLPLLRKSRGRVILVSSVFGKYSKKP
ncbi:hypothetical protein HPB48_006146 [Haemaphysalis longicornis]|uniref:Uncharacterized protein n=1 Tax=Haemaphysalis longicornis TaxID=44386 RepID=A0A9J6GNK8_HAELO|nr:hypothetical protein HPB48_006146 [Haemaphysalis longicornis]